MSENLTHVDGEGQVSMVDVGDKTPQKRIAVAEGFIQLNPNTVKLIKENSMKKGDVLTTAKIAGIQGAKQTQNLIPLCHQLMLNKIGVDTELLEDGVKVTAMVTCTGKTGVEMEALTAVSTALLTVYDMSKAVDKDMIIRDITLLSKEKIDL